MRRRIMVGTAILAALFARTAEAQHAGTVELGAFARYTDFPFRMSTLPPPSDGSSLDNHAGFGARAGYFLSPMLGLEADASRTVTHDPSLGGQAVSFTLIHLRLAINLPVADRLSLLFAGGGAFGQYGKAGSSHETGGGVLAGARVRLTELLALRINATADHFDHHSFITEHYWNLGAEAGLSVLLGAHRAHYVTSTAAASNPGESDSLARLPAPTAAARDTDGDGVPDSRDSCASTRRGETVDQTGCPALFSAGRSVTVLEHVGFEPESAELSREALEVLWHVAQSLKAHPELVVEVAAFGDDGSGSAADQELAQKRADAVAAFLAEKGALATQLIPKGYSRGLTPGAARVELRSK